jgi:hypothetical protein
VRNRAAERRLRCGRGVGVDELPVLGRLGEGVDAALLDAQPGRNADFLANLGADLVEAGNRHSRLFAGM